MLNVYGLVNCLPYDPSHELVLLNRRRIRVRQDLIRRVFIKKTIIGAEGSLQHPINKLFDDSTAIYALLLESLFVIEDDFILFPQIPIHAAIKSVQELIAPPHRDYQIIIDLFLEEERSIVVLLIVFDEVFQLGESRLKSKSEGKVLQHVFNCSRPHSELEGVQHFI